MARFEQDREDILREATALVERVEITAAHEPEPVVAGFRRDGGLSIYFGADPVVQFLATGELRRGYDGGRLLKAEGGTLVAIRRERTPDETILRSQPLSDSETSSFRERIVSRLRALREAISHGTAQTLRQVPESGEVLNRLRIWLEQWNEQLVIAERPNVGGASRP